MSVALAVMACVWLLSMGAPSAAAAELTQQVSQGPASSQPASTVKQGEKAKPTTEKPPSPKAMPRPAAQKLPSGPSSGKPEGVAGVQGHRVETKIELK
ncbi:MAG: hypothetical protein AB1646_18055 [Thermodesulfobacteriota bacterium]